MTKGTLYIIPSPLGETSALSVTPPGNVTIIKSLRYFIVEDTKTARRYLHQIGMNTNDPPVEFLEFNEHSETFDVSSFMKSLKQGFNTGLLSDAGIPCVADPGSVLVREAHRLQINVVPLSGPSSLFMALMASGFNGQQFHFHGYLPVDKTERSHKLKDIEKSMRFDRCTHLFIETPYRNRQMLETILKVCQDQTLLCIASGISEPKEFVKSKSIGEWKRSPIPDIHKVPAVFLLSDGNHIK